jgi:riboflavin-specific deaminase-like protein
MATTKTARPAVTVKFAQTLDGRLATSIGESKWISSEQSLKFAHKLRSEHDAILVGVGTVLADDPQLNVRLVQGRDPVRIVVDSRLRIPTRARLLSDGAGRGTLIATTERAAAGRVRKLQTLGAEVLRLPARQTSAKGKAGVDMAALLVELGRRGIKSVLVEGGAEVITSLLRAKLVDRLIVVIAPKIIGRGKESIGDLGITRMRDAMKFLNVKVRRIGADLVFDARLRAG